MVDQSEAIGISLRVGFIAPLLIFFIFLIVAGIFTYRTHKQQVAEFKPASTTEKFIYKMPIWIIVMWVLASVALAVAVTFAIVGNVANEKLRTFASTQLDQLKTKIQMANMQRK